MNVKGALKEIEEEDPKTVCQFCGSSEVKSLEWGPMYQFEGVTLHYFCLLFSAGLRQSGEDEQGILGFLPHDIQKELRRGDKLKCRFCRKPRATIGCSIAACKSSYHYPCGLKNGCQFHFLENYESFCPKHFTKPTITLPRNEWKCPICAEDFESDEIPLFPPCCKRAVFHRICILEMAKNHGCHFFKCPLCNNKDIFSVAMRSNGVYAPERDASWETEPDAFADHSALHSRCDAKNCLCREPGGRDYNGKSDRSDWKMVRCGSCAAVATHKLCSNLEKLWWECPTCSNVLSGSGASSIQQDHYGANEDEELRNQEPILTMGSIIKEFTSASSGAGVTVDSDDEKWERFDFGYGSNLAKNVGKKSDHKVADQQIGEKVNILTFPKSKKPRRSVPRSAVSWEKELINPRLKQILATASDKIIGEAEKHNCPSSEYTKLSKALDSFHVKKKRNPLLDSNGDNYALVSDRSRYNLYCGKLNTLFGKCQSKTDGTLIAGVEEMEYGGISSSAALARSSQSNSGIACGIPVVSLPPLEKDNLIIDDNRKTVKGHIDLAEASEIVRESDLQLLKVSAKGTRMESCNGQLRQTSKCSSSAVDK